METVALKAQKDKYLNEVIKRQTLHHFWFIHTSDVFSKYQNSALIRSTAL